MEKHIKVLEELFDNGRPWFFQKEKVKKLYEASAEALVALRKYSELEERDFAEKIGLSWSYFLLITRAGWLIKARRLKKVLEVIVSSSDFKEGGSIFR